MTDEPKVPSAAELLHRSRPATAGGHPMNMTIEAILAELAECGYSESEVRRLVREWPTNRTGCKDPMFLESFYKIERQWQKDNGFDAVVTVEGKPAQALSRAGFLVLILTIRPEFRDGQGT
jgi:hypothetical protein